MILADRLEIRSWTRDALCARPPFDEWNWILDTEFGHENASTVTTRFEVCAACPVRRRCLEDALMETSHTVVGVFGGTTTTERSHTLNALRTEGRAQIDQERQEWIRAARLDARHDRQLRARTAEELDSTFGDRRRSWHAKSRQPWCFDCNQTYLRLGDEPRCTQWCNAKARRSARRKVQRERRKRRLERFEHRDERAIIAA